MLIFTSRGQWRIVVLLETKSNLISKLLLRLLIIFLKNVQNPLKKKYAPMIIRIIQNNKYFLKVGAGVFYM